MHFMCPTVCLIATFFKCSYLYFQKVDLFALLEILENFCTKNEISIYIPSVAQKKKILNAKKMQATRTDLLCIHAEKCDDFFFLMEMEIFRINIHLRTFLFICGII